MLMLKLTLALTLTLTLMLTSTLTLLLTFVFGGRFGVDFDIDSSNKAFTIHNSQNLFLSFIIKNFSTYLILGFNYDLEYHKYNLIRTVINTNFHFDLKLNVNMNVDVNNQCQDRSKRFAIVFELFQLNFTLFY